MPTESLLSTLCSLERALHDPSVRRNREHLVRLLHPEFRESAARGLNIPRHKSSITYSRKRMLQRCTLKDSQSSSWRRQWCCSLTSQPIFLLPANLSAMPNVRPFGGARPVAGRWCFTRARRLSRLKSMRRKNGFERSQGERQHAHCHVSLWSCSNRRAA
jgi:hypothetical protein